MGMFSVVCETVYQSNWFPLKKPETRFASSRPCELHVIHRISGRDPEWTEHEVRVARVRAACPRAGIAGDEFTEISAGAGGSVQIFFADGPITLKRTWLPLTPGFYSTGDSSELGVKMQYNVSMDGTVDVKLGCACGGDTGFKKYELVGTGIDNPYEVKPIEDGDTLEDLVGSLKMACPGFSEDSFLTDNYQRVGFATEDVIYVTGDFITDSLHRQLS
ncbi:hypothetical protein FOZ61_010061 [Perkinsus olseni]|uniref:Uncharacterized protein n=1 Tax=Perkinsus olseni TaxID=32597 RepID=A0A7J6KXD9_PEROL|nr:hypothetical protein FOZ61_010061 [Perkinsus olseni]KAF4653783.1 hypothetical protein FOL46_009009 [Perkinsus olseni]